MVLGLLGYLIRKARGDMNQDERGQMILDIYQ